MNLSEIYILQQFDARIYRFTQDQFNRYDYGRYRNDLHVHIRYSCVMDRNVILVRTERYNYGSDIIEHSHGFVGGVRSLILCGAELCPYKPWDDVAIMFYSDRVQLRFFSQGKFLTHVHVVPDIFAINS